MELKSAGAAYDPFLAESEAGEGDSEHIGVTIVKKRANDFSYCFHEGINMITIEL